MQLDPLCPWIILYLLFREEFWLTETWKRSYRQILCKQVKSVKAKCVSTFVQLFIPSKLVKNCEWLRQDLKSQCTYFGVPSVSTFWMVRKIGNVVLGRLNYTNTWSLFLVLFLFIVKWKSLSITITLGVVVSQLAEWLLPSPEVCGSNPVIGEF